MSIRPPRMSGDYIDRDMDCQEAIEQQFLEQVRAAKTAYLDLAKIKTAIASDALEAGWTKEDLDDALLELARCYALKITPRTARDQVTSYRF